MLVYSDGLEAVGEYGYYVNSLQLSLIIYAIIDISQISFLVLLLQSTEYFSTLTYVSPVAHNPTPAFQ